jgi:hypothetical protein
MGEIKIIIELGPSLEKHLEAYLQYLRNGQPDQNGRFEVQRPAPVTPIDPNVVLSMIERFLNRGNSAEERRDSDRWDRY